MTPAMRTRAVLAIGWVALAALSWLGVWHARRTPVALPAYAPATMFSAHRATSYLQPMTMQPHPTGGGGSTMVRTYLLAQLRGLGLLPIVQTTTGVGTRYAVAGRVSNILVRLPGSRPSRLAVLLMAHYDAVPASPGAGDDGSGVATLLETLRALKSGPPLQNDVIALFTDGEEAGLLGAAAFVKEHPWSASIGVVMNFEARGTTGPSLMFETGPGNLDVARMLRRVPGVRATSLSTAVYRAMPNDTDLSEFASLGVPALNFAFIGGVNRYHTSQDDLAHLDPRSLQHHGDQALALTRAFGNAPLPRPATSDAVFFDFPILGLVVYPQGWAIVIGLLGMVLAIVAVLRGRAADGEGRGWVVATSLGALATIVSIVLGCVSGFALGSALLSLHAMLETGTPQGSALYAIAIAFVAIAVTTGTFAIVSRLRGEVARARLECGALVVWALVGLIASILAPGVSFVFVWPALVVAVARAIAPRHRAGRVALWMAAAIALLICAPIVYQMAYVALGVDQVGGVLIGLFGALLTALLIDIVQSPDGEGHRWWSTLSAASVSLLAFIVGTVTVRTNANHPAGVSLVYATDADSAGAWLTGYASTGSAKARLSHFLRDVARESGPSTSAPSTTPAWLRSGLAQIAPVPVQRMDIPRSEASVLSDSTVGGERRVNVRFRPAPGVYAVIMTTEGPVLGAAVDGKPVSQSGYRVRQRQWNLQYVAPPDSGFVLGLRIPVGQANAVGFSTRASGIPALKVPPRPEGIVQVQTGNMTWMHYRLPL